MPRGARAVYGQERDTGHRTADEDHPLTMLMPVADRLPALCWCTQFIVGVPQAEILECRTRSCGRAACFGDDMDDRQLGFGVTGSSWVISERPCTEVGAKYGGDDPGVSLRKVLSAEQRRRRVAEELQHRPRADRPPPTVRRRKRRKTSPHVAERRDLVAAQWEAGRRYVDIAADLGVAYMTVYNDVACLRKAGRLR